MNRFVTTSVCTFLVLAASDVLAAEKKPAEPTSTTETTSAEPPAEDPSVVAAREKAEKEAARRKAEAESRAGLQVAPIFGYGFHSTQLHSSLLSAGSESVSAYGPGIGARAGYVLTRGMYVGGAFVFHFGESRDVQGGKAEGRVMYVGPELGQQVQAGPIWIRPYAGIGFASVTLKAPLAGKELDSSGGKLAIWPGVTAIVPFADNRFFAGADARWVAILGVDNQASASGATLAVTGGARF